MKIETQRGLPFVFLLLAGVPEKISGVSSGEKHIMILAFIIVGFFIGLSVLTVSVVIITRAYRQSKTYKNKLLTDWFQAEIAEFLFNREIKEIPEDLIQVKKLARRQLIIDEIVRLQSDLSGEVADQLKYLYESLGLQKDSMDKLNRSKWEIKAKGFRELSVMGVTEAIPLIKRYTSSKNETLRGEAFLALVRMKSDDPLDFLEMDDVILTPWDQLNLQVFIQRGGKEIPEFKRWLSSGNETVLQFAIKMASLHKQFDAVPEIVKHLEHTNSAIRKDVIRALGNMEAPEYSYLLKKRFLSENTLNSLAIIGAIGNIGNPDDLDFLIHVISSSSDFDLLLASFKALHLMGKKGKEKIQEFSVQDPQKYLKFAMHVNDRRI